MKHYYVSLIVPVSVVIPIVIAVVNKSYQRNNLKPILNYLLFAALTEVISISLATHGINNLPLLHLYTIGEFLFILRFFQLISKEPGARRLLVWIMALFTAFCIADLIFLQSIFQYNSYPRPLGALIIIALCMSYFLKNTTTENQKPWVTEPLNWMVTGLLVYFGSSLFHFAFLNVIADNASRNVSYLLGTIHATLVMVMYLLFAIGFWHAKND